MNQVGVIIALIFSLIVAIFALLNNQPVSINYFFGTVDVSSVIIILGAAFSGALIVFLLGIYRQIKLSVKVRGLNADIRDMEKEMELLYEENEELAARLGDIKDNSETGHSVEVEDTLVNLGKKEKKPDDYHG